MKKNWLFWLPRILAILFTAMISLFAFDMFEGNSSIWEKLLGFLIHLIPTYVLVILLVIAWKLPLPGGILFILAGSSYFLFASEQHWSAYLIVSGIPMLIGILFILDQFLAKKKAPLV
ncbi:MAG: hypothetical protein FJZ98_03040 [Chloroflexi bacterium]|nr:hypothetical protein [Chloroflexota bacterium]